MLQLRSIFGKKYSLQNNKFTVRHNMLKSHKIFLRDALEKYLMQQSCSQDILLSFFDKSRSPGNEVVPILLAIESNFPVEARVL